MFDWGGERDIWRKKSGKIRIQVLLWHRKKEEVSVGTNSARLALGKEKLIKASILSLEFLSRKNA